MFALMRMIGGVESWEIFREMYRILVMFAFICITLPFKVIILLTTLQKRVVRLTDMTIQHLAELSGAVHGVLCDNICSILSRLSSNLKIA
jgi:hypothetical protein